MDGSIKMKERIKEGIDEKIKNLPNGAKAYLLDLMLMVGIQDLNKWTFIDYVNGPKGRSTLEKYIKILEEADLIVRGHLEYKGTKKLITNKLYIRLNIYKDKE